MKSNWWIVGSFVLGLALLLQSGCSQPAELPTAEESDDLMIDDETMTGGGEPVDAGAADADSADAADADAAADTSVDP